MITIGRLVDKIPILRVIPRAVNSMGTGISLPIRIIAVVTVFLLLMALLALLVILLAAQCGIVDLFGPTW